MHLANHLERIAAFSLPRNVGGSDEEGNENAGGSSAASQGLIASSDRSMVMS